MTITTFSPASLNPTTIYNWDSAANWSTLSVPNSATAVVVFPVVTNLLSAQAMFYEVQILTGESFEASRVTLNGGEVVNAGTLSILNELVTSASGSVDTYSADGKATLTAASVDNAGGITSSGQLTVSGDLVNRGAIGGGNLDISAGKFENIGSLVALYDQYLTVSVGDGGFANLSGGTLTGGLYSADSGQTISFNVNGPITTLAASVYLGGATQTAGMGGLQTYAAAGTSSYVALRSSLTTIAPSGLFGVERGSYSLVQSLTDEGTIIVASGTLSAPGLTISSTGTLVANGNSTLSVNSTIIDDGTIVAALGINGFADEASTVVIGAAVRGTGSLVIGTGGSLPGTPEYVPIPVTLELAGADSANVVFADKIGMLQLQAPQSFTGSVEGFTGGNQIILSGVSLQSVTGYSYTGDATHGVLTLQETGGASLTFSFQGNYTTSDFSLAAGTQTTSVSPASIVISDSAGAPTAAITAAAAIAALRAGTLSAGTIITDTAADIASNLDMLQTMKAAGEIGQIVLVDADDGAIAVTTQATPPAITLTAAQITNDNDALQDIAGAYRINVVGATAIQAENLAGSAHVASIAVSDSIGDIASQIDQLGALAATGQVSSIAVTDTSFAAIAVSAAQYTTNHTAFMEMTGDYTVTVSAQAGGAQIEGLSGHSVTVIFPSTASQYSLTTQGDGVGLTVSGVGISESLRDVTALKFNDVTDIVAQTPGSNGVVTTGNIAELYGAAFGRVPDVAGLAFYQGVLSANPGTSLTTFAQYFLASPEYTGNLSHTYAQSTAGDTQFITDAYQNLLHRAPEDGAIPFYLKVIDAFTNGLTADTAAYAAAQTLGHAYVLTYFSQSPEFLTDVQVTATAPSSAQHWLVLL